MDMKMHVKPGTGRGASISTSLDGLAGFFNVFAHSREGIAGTQYHGTQKQNYKFFHRILHLTRLTHEDFCCNRQWHAISSRARSLHFDVL
jgi:hypothetical protein